MAVVDDIPTCPNCGGRLERWSARGCERGGLVVFLSGLSCPDCRYSETADPTFPAPGGPPVSSAPAAYRVRDMPTVPGHPPFLPDSHWCLIHGAYLPATSPGCPACRDLVTVVSATPGAG